MKEKNKNRNVLIGSISLASAIALVTVSIGPSLILIQEPEVIVKKIEEQWDIIVPDHYKTIQQAIDNAKPGYRILVKSGTYRASRSSLSRSITIKKEGLTIHGENKETTIINGGSAKEPVKIRADNVNFSGFTVKNYGVNGSAIILEADNCIINNNIIIGSDHYDGIEYIIRVDGDTNTISNNTVYGSDYGIEFQGCKNNIVENNTIRNTDYAMKLESKILFFSDRELQWSYTGCNGFIIKDNNITSNLLGIYCLSSYDNVYYNNTFDSNVQGFFLSSCKDEIIENNNFIKDSLTISGIDVDYYIHEINGNTVNGKPLYYFKNEEDFTVPSDAGQIIIVKCRAVKINNVVISDTSTAILVAYSSNVRIENCEFSSNNQGVLLLFSSSCYVLRNNFIKNFRDAFFIVQGLLKSKTIMFRYNYWDSWLGTKFLIFRLTRKRIWGRFHINTLLNIKVLDLFGLGWRTRNFDRSPRATPYSIQY